MSGPYEKPKAKRGMVCHAVRWDRQGRVIMALYRPVEKPAPAMEEGATCRVIRPGAVALERQGKLL